MIIQLNEHELKEGVIAYLFEQYQLSIKEEEVTVTYVEGCHGACVRLQEDKLKKE